MKRDLTQLSTQQFDLLVCGGGIYGAWTAYDAALRGLKVAIIEKNDWASATSSASSKLIHGGLRYLESFDFKLVKKALAERSQLLQSAPHRVWPLRFGVPVYTDSRIGKLKLKLGLTLYDFLAGNTQPAMPHLYLNREDFSNHFPALNNTGLTGGFTYADAQTDDARLVLELIAGATAAGAVAVNYCKVTEPLETQGQASGVLFQDQQSDLKDEIHARQIVNTTGQWTTTSSQGRQWCRLAKGIHLVMPSIPGEEALLLTAKSDGRVFFLIPWYGVTLLGTTDTDYNGNLEQVTTEPEDINYLLNAANDHLETGWTQNDIIGKYAGVRVLKQNTSTASPSSLSRDWELKTLANGIHYSIGGKITSARQDAATIVDTVCTQLGIQANCATTGKHFPWAPAENYTEWAETMRTEATQLNIDSESTRWLLRRHGKHVTDIFHRITQEPELVERIIPSLPFIYADLLHCANTEMVVRLDDLLRRRMPLLILTQLTKQVIQQLATQVAPILGWEDTVVNQEIENCCKQWLQN